MSGLISEINQTSLIIFVIHLEENMSTWKFKTPPIHPSEVTPEHAYTHRRDFLKSMGILTAGALLAACSPGMTNDPTQSVSETPGTAAMTDELGDPVNTYEQITNYNNYYEFTLSKEGVAEEAENFEASPWQVEVYGQCNKPKTFTMEELLALFPQEERIYRLRCVEAWSMVIPWNGFELSKMLEVAEPNEKAKYVRFETLLDKEQMPGQKNPLYPWPYQEGLRMDEAMHPLTILATGLYGKPMPDQNGAPIRLVVPWKYGFKSIKSIVRIEFVEEQPATMWSSIAPDEYGFYANVNPEVDHPRWSQSSERRIGELSRRPTLMFNGYEEDVASLYEGMDLSIYY
jgi:sulfoxide reductase catalytic subunit YedY